MTSPTAGRGSGSSSSSSSAPAPLRRLVDYFVICGLDESCGLEVLPTYEMEGPSEPTSCPPLEKSYKAKILAHFPENVPGNPFDQDAVRNLCLPDGLLFRTQKHSLDPCFHPFLITKEDGSRIHGFSFVFFEVVHSQHVVQAIQTLQAMHLTELSSAKSYHQKRAAQNRNIRNAQATLSRQKKSSKIQAHHQTFFAAADDLDGTNTRSLPRHFKLAAQKQQSFYDTSKDTLYVTKAIAIIAALPFVTVAHHFLQGLYKTVLKGGTEDSRLSVESYIYHLLHTVPLPPPSRTVQLNYWSERLCCVRPKPQHLPLLDYFMGDLFRILDLDSFLQMFTCVLLENQVLLYSKDLYRLMLVAESVTSVLFPFTWQHVYVPILPSTLHHFLDAPVPFIMGLHAVAAESKENIPCEANLCFVDIDHNKVTVPEDLPPFPHRQDLMQELASVLNAYNIPAGNLNKSHHHRTVVIGASPYRTMRRSRKNSWSHDSDSGMSSNEESSLSSWDNHRRRSSASNGTNPLVSSGTGSLFDEGDGSQLNDIYLRNLKLNNSLREIFCNRFVHMFASYDHFLSHPNEQGNSRMFIHNFDKATFLSDQPDQDLPFLSRFIETQMFASFIDRKIALMSGAEMEPHLDSNLVIFEQRIKIIRGKFGESLVRTPSYEPCTSTVDTEKFLDNAFNNPNFIVPPVEELVQEGSNGIPQPFSDTFPSFLNLNELHWGSQETQLPKCTTAAAKSLELVANNGEDIGTVGPSSIRPVFQPSQSTSSPAAIAQANWEFIKQLLQECKTKTKRMLVEKMGPEAVALGHGEVSILGVEENTLVASLCDLLERIWAHGLHVKGKGRSPLWNYLTNYQESEACKDSSKPIDPQFLTPDLSTMASELNITPTSSPHAYQTTPTSGASPISAISASARESPQNHRHSPSLADRHSRRSRGHPELPIIKPLPVSIAFDMRNVQSISEIKTEIGYARAWIRLSLEKKVLSNHLRALLADDELLRGLYKRTAFLRSEDEREQFLYHLLTLNAADYYCFTNTYVNIVLPYRIIIFPCKRFNISTTTANVWISVSGTLGETPCINVPKNALEHCFQHKNLGFLANVHLGHDNSGVSPKWLVDFVIVRNEVTGHIVKFPCGRWLGREVDDGSTERLLVGEPFYDGEDCPVESKLKTPPRARSPSVSRRHLYDNNPQEIQESLGNAVNKIVKYFFKTEKERGSLTVLLCGENGLVAALERVFSFGFKSTRLFGRNIYLWDYFVQVAEAFESLRGIEEGDEEGDVMTCYCQLIRKINYHANTLGKNGKFQLLICLCAREHLLPRLPPLFTTLPVTRQMYEEHSFLRDSDLVHNLIQVLLALDDYDIVLEQSLSKGIE